MALSMTRAEWERTLRGSSYEAVLRGMSAGERETVYRTAVKNLDEQPGNVGGEIAQNPNDAVYYQTEQAIKAVRSFEQNPSSSNVPAGAKSRNPKQNDKLVTTAQANVQASQKGTATEKKTAEQNLEALLGGGTGTYYPWMSQAAQDASGNPVDVFGPDASSPALPDESITAWRHQWNAQNPTQTYGDNASFMKSKGVVEGRPEYRAAFQQALNLGSNETRTYSMDLSLPGGKGHGYETRVNTQWVDLANNAVKGGTPALDRYMNLITGLAKANRVPWQLLWGVLRARMGGHPSAGGAGLFNIDPNVIGSSSLNDATSQIAYLAQQLRQGYEQTNDWALAAVYTDDQQSALSLRHTGHSTSGRQMVDGQYLASVFGGQDSQGKGMLSLYDIGFGHGGENPHTHPEGVLHQLGGLGEVSSSSSGPTITVPDMNLLRQQADTMIRTLLFREPSQDEVEQMAMSMRDAVVQAQTQATATSATNPYAQLYDGAAPSAPGHTEQQVDPQAGMLAQIKGSGDYQQLYGHRGALSEQDYAQQFQNVEQDLLGSGNADTGLLRQGLESGSPDEFRTLVYGSGFGNRTFRQRLYQTAQAIAQV